MNVLIIIKTSFHNDHFSYSFGLGEMSRRDDIIVTKSKLVILKYIFKGKIYN